MFMFYDLAMKTSKCVTIDPDHKKLNQFKINPNLSTIDIPIISNLKAFFINMITF